MIYEYKMKQNVAEFAENTMQANPKKVKLIIFLAITLVAILLVSCIALAISIFNTNNKIKKQQEEIEKLNNQIEYYRQLENQENPDFNFSTED